MRECLSWIWCEIPEKPQERTFFPLNNFLAVLHEIVSTNEIVFGNDELISCNAFLKRLEVDVQHYFRYFVWMKASTGIFLFCGFLRLKRNGTFWNCILVQEKLAQFLYFDCLAPRDLIVTLRRESLNRNCHFEQFFTSFFLDIFMYE